MALPALPIALAKLGPILKEALPFLGLGLFGRQKKEERLSEEEKVLLRLRAQLAQMMLGRQQQLEPLFRSTAQGIFGGLPAFAKEGRTLNFDLPREPGGADLRALFTNRFGGQ